MWMPTDKEIKEMTQNALTAFWGLRHQGDSAVRAGKTMDGFADMIKKILYRCGVSESEIIMGRTAKLPSFYRLSKDWDMVVLKDLPDGTKRLLSVIEFKSMKGSVGKNLNNRVEEAIGSSTDLWKAFEKGAFGLTKPFLGYIYVLADDPELLSGTDRSSILFSPLEEYMHFPRTGNPANYAERAEIFMKNMVQEKLYDKCAYLIANPSNVGEYVEPNSELTIELLIKALVGHVSAHLDTIE